MSVLEKLGVSDIDIGGRTSFEKHEVWRVLHLKFPDVRFISLAVLASGGVGVGAGVEPRLVLLIKPSEVSGVLLSLDLWRFPKEWIVTGLINSMIKIYKIQYILQKLERIHSKYVELVYCARLLKHETWTWNSIDP